MSHTPGPWEALGNLVRDARNAEGAGGYMVADCAAPARAPEERLANARLIAAAPDLLAALIALANAYGGQPASYGGAYSTDEERVMINARAAIAKAKGE